MPIRRIVYRGTVYILIDKDVGVLHVFRKESDALQKASEYLEEFPDSEVEIEYKELE